MTRLEELQIRKAKLDVFFKSLKPEELMRVDNSGCHSESTPLYSVIGEEYQKIEFEIARIRLDEYLNMDANFEQEVLSDNSNR